VALNRVVLLLALLSLPLLKLQLLALALFTFSMDHLLLSLSLDEFALPGVALALAVDGLRRGMLHSLSDGGERVSGAVGRGRRVLSIGWGLMRAAVALAQLRQPREGVARRLARGVVRAWGKTEQSDQTDPYMVDIIS
jgi:hypothetical protein